MTSFLRIHPQLRHAIAEELGGRGLRPVQELATDAILDGCNVVVLAPTAGGKTEASIFPVLSRILAEELRPVSALYICPIRALLNNQEERIQRYARMVGLDAFKWHGDVAATAKERFRREPSHILMITPESLEVMLISQKSDARELFARLSAVIIDEVHAFAGDDRGAHLVALLERLSRFCGRDLQRIGLSATVGNPDEIGRWLQGSSARPYRRVDPPKPAAARDLGIDFCEDDAALGSEAARLGKGKKSLVFVETRSGAERIAAAMNGGGVDVFIHHSSVSRADRQLAEERFASGWNTAIVCTSTMELGIDVGDLDRVIQIDAPYSVASFLQRTGRTGRREGSRSNCTFLCKSPEALVQAVALLRLVERGWVEDVRPPQAAAHVLAHQILALTLQEGGVSRHEVLPWIRAADPFRAIGEEEVASIINHMIGAEVLYESDGLLSLGHVGERVYGTKNFFELYAVFSSPSILRVVHGKEEVGTIQATFLRTGDEEKRGPPTFRLAGRAWLVQQVEWNRGVCFVTPAEHGRIPSWIGAPMGLSFALCQEIKRTLAGETRPPWLTDAAFAELSSLRLGYDGLVGEGEATIAQEDDGIVWHTFAGAFINRLLAAVLERQGHGRWVAGSLSLRHRDGMSLAAASEAIASLRDADWDALSLAEGAASMSGMAPISKFQRCLPPEVQARLVSASLFDPEGARSFLASHSFPLAGRNAQ